MVIEKTPFQSFHLDFSNVVDCISLVSRGVNTRYAIADALGMGEKKVEGIFEWAEFLGLLESRKRTEEQELTSLGSAILRIPRFPENTKALEILYAVIAFNHPLVCRLINSFVYDVSRKFDPIFDTEEFKAALLHVGRGFDVNPFFLAKRSYIYLGLLSGASSFGRLGIVVKQNDGKSFRVNSRRPDWVSAAYILYDSWPENVARMRISEVVSGQGSLGRVFFLTESEVMVLLSKLEQERAIALEVVADLSQIGLNPARTSDDFLEMLINEGG